MRLRTCIRLGSALGAGGALLLAADLYRRLQAFENAAQIIGAASSGDLPAYFGMMHVIGVLALAFVLVSIFLLSSIPEPEKRSVAQAVPAAAPEASPAPEEQPVEVIPDEEPAAEPQQTPNS